MSMWSTFIIGIWLFAMFIAILPLMNMGNMTTQAVLAANPGLNATQKQAINSFSANVFLNTPDVILAVLYFVMILATFIAASYEGANPAVILLLGLFFIVVAEMVSFGIADVAHAYISQTIYLNLKQHMTITTYIMEYLPYFNGILIVAYMLFIITRREQLSEGSYTGAGGGDSVVSL